MHGGDFCVGRAEETLKLAQSARQQNRDWVNVFYLSGLSVEHMLWGIRCKRANLMNADHTEAPGHSLSRIAIHAGLQLCLEAETKKRRSFSINWKVVCDWDSNARYRQVSKRDASDMFLAVANPQHGVMPWLRGRYQTLP